MTEERESGAIRVCIETQRLILETPDRAARVWSVSTARNGPGEQFGSEQSGLRQARVQLGRIQQVVRAREVGIGHERDDNRFGLGTELETE